MRYAKFHILNILIIIFVASMQCIAHAEMTLCDCMNNPMDSDAKVTECSAIFDALDPKSSRESKRAC